MNTLQNIDFKSSEAFGFTSQPKLRSTLIEPTEDTPFVMYVAETNKLIIKGNSKGLDMHEFYRSLFYPLKQQMDLKQGCHLEFFFKTLNTSTVKILFDLFKYLRNEKLKGNDVRVTWRAEVSNPDMLETGMDFSELFDLNFLVICA